MKVIDKGTQDYNDTWQDMRQFTDNRDVNTEDEIWVLEHLPVFTLGFNGKPEHILSDSTIPVVQCDRGGQVTYHGPGQLVAYLLLDLKRRKLGVKQLVFLMEQVVIQLLDEYRISAERRDNAPGVYVDNAKIAALGLRIRKGCSYHGLSLNVDMDLRPFSLINPCGYVDLKSTQLKDHVQNIEMVTVKQQLVSILQQQLS